MLLSLFMEITFSICMNRINFLNLKLSSDRLVIVANGFLRLPKLQALMKQKSTSLPRNLTFNPDLGGLFRGSF